MALLTVEDLSFSHFPPAEDGATIPTLHAISFSVDAGEFAVLCGETGCGKSTLLRLLKPELAPRGQRTGSIRFADHPISAVKPDRIGFVAQRPEEQIVTDKVYSELAFGPESMGLPQPQIARQIAEMASYFGMEDWFDRDVASLSGGQKQLLNLASVMVMHPDLLLLDEPTSQLDPIAAAEFLTTLQRLNRDFSLTILLAEHRLEEIIPTCDRMLLMEDGRLTDSGTPREIVSRLPHESPMLDAMPAAVRLYHRLDESGFCPMTVREGRRFLEEHYRASVRSLPASPYRHKEDCALECRDVFFRYERHSPDVLRGFSLTVYENEIMCLLGGNGSGKTTALSCIADIRRPYSGSIRIFGKKHKEYPGQSLRQGCLSLLPQDVQTVFLCNSVKEELADAGVDPSSLPFDLSPLLARHPYDLSGGEQQLLALAKVLATKPRLLLLDEPTKGLDARKKQLLIEILRKLKAQGATVLLVTHDIEFAATCADRCALCFRGEIVSLGTPREFFSENSFYTTAISRMTRRLFSDAVTVPDAVRLCLENGRREPPC